MSGSCPDCGSSYTTCDWDYENDEETVAHYICDKCGAEFMEREEK